MHPVHTARRLYGTSERDSKRGITSESERSERVCMSGYTSPRVMALTCLSSLLLKYTLFTRAFLEVSQKREKGIRSIPDTGTGNTDVSAMFPVPVFNIKLCRKAPVTKGLCTRYADSAVRHVSAVMPVITVLRCVYRG